jgi:hypothetical protein
VAMPPAFLVPCQITALGIDVTDVVGRVLHERLWQTASSLAARPPGSALRRTFGWDPRRYFAGAFFRSATSFAHSASPPARAGFSAP